MHDCNKHAVVSVDKSWTEIFKMDMVEGVVMMVAIDVQLAGVSSILQLRNQNAILVRRECICWETG